MVFHGYLTGSTTPTWDFYGTYLTGAHSWWQLGGFLHPPTFLPYVAGGSPAFMAVQSSGWYLPVGVAALLASYTPHVAAVVQALTIAFGCVGVNLLARHLGLSRSISLVAAVGYLFTAGFFSNAQHVDIVRAWGMIPWLLLALSASWLGSVWRVALACLLWFQFFVGAYPGSIAAAVYLCGGWASLALWRLRGERRSYLAWAATTIGVGCLLAMPKWLPYLLASGTVYAPGNEIVVNRDLLATVFFPFTSDSLPNDITMRTLFVVPLLVMAAFFVHGHRRLVQHCVLLICIGVLLGFPIPGLERMQEALPLLQVSRFRTMDFKIGIILGTVLLGAAGIQSIVERRERSKAWWLTRASLAVGTTVVLCLCGLNAGLPRADVALGLTWVALSSAALLGTILIARLPARERWQSGPSATAIAGLALVTVFVVGGWWANSCLFVWSVPRVKAELSTWGTTAADLIEQREPAILPQRPARSGPSFPTTEPIMASQGWNGADYSRLPTLGGYTSKSTQYWNLTALATSPTGVDDMALLRKPSTVWLLPAASPVGAGSGTCALEGGCTVPGMVVTSWSPDRIHVDVPPGTEGRLVTNELSYPGWWAEVCRQGDCADSEVASGEEDLYLSAQIPSGATSVDFVYRTPYIGPASALFWLGVVVLGLVSVAVRVRMLRRTGD